MQTPLDDIMVVLEWLCATKTPTNNAARALDRLRDIAKREKHNSAHDAAHRNDDHNTNEGYDGL